MLLARSAPARRAQSRPPARRVQRGPKHFQQASRSGSGGERRAERGQKERGARALRLTALVHWSERRTRWGPAGAFLFCQRGDARRTRAEQGTRGFARLGAAHPGDDAFRRAAPQRTRVPAERGAWGPHAAGDRRDLAFAFAPGDRERRRGCDERRCTDASERRMLAAGFCFFCGEAFAASEHPLPFSASAEPCLAWPLHGACRAGGGRLAVCAGHRDAARGRAPGGWPRPGRGAEWRCVLLYFA